jgi:hypothetical protein
VTNSYHILLLKYHLCKSIQIHIKVQRMSHSSVINIIIGVWAGYQRNHGLIPNSDKRSVSCAKHPDWFWGTHVLLSTGFLGLPPSPRVKVPGTCSWLLTLSHTEVRNKWSCTSIAICNKNQQNAHFLRRWFYIIVFSLTCFKQPILRKTYTCSFMVFFHASI